MVSRATEAFLEPQCPVYLQEPSSNPSANEAGEAADIVVFEDLGHNAMETMTAAGNEPVSLFNASLEHITKEIDDFYSLCEEMDVRPLPLEDSFIIVDGSNFEVPSSPQPPRPRGLLLTTLPTPHQAHQLTALARPVSWLGRDHSRAPMKWRCRSSKSRRNC